MDGSRSKYSLQNFGSFYIGGREISVSNQPTKTVVRNKDVKIDIDPNGEYVIETIYVQYFLPEKYKSVCILIHGGGHTGAVWETTPDGRKGWLHLLLEQGMGVYIIDTVERGRAGWCAMPGFWPGEPEMRSHQSTWKFFRMGESMDQPYPNLQFPVENFSNLVKYNVPRWNCNAAVSATALKKLIEKVGCCSLIVHSQGADIAMQCLELAPELVDNVVLVEPAAFPKITPNFQFNHLKTFIIYGDNIRPGTFWDMLLTKARSYQKYLKQIGIKTELISLPEAGFFGNSHVIMMDRNNDQILQFILDKL